MFWRKEKNELPAVEKQNRRADVEEQGRWYFRRDILDRLDDYMYYAKKLRRVDHDGYNYVSRVGAILGSKNSAFGYQELSPRWRQEGQNLGAGAVAYPTSYDTKDSIAPKFIYFSRIDNRPPHLQPTNARDIYKVIMFYSENKDDTRFDRGGYPLMFHIGITATGEIMLLKEKKDTEQLFKSKGRRGRSNPSDTVTHHSMGIPRGVLEIARDNNFAVNEWVKTCVTYAMNHYENSSMDLIVRARKGSTTAAFSVDLLRTPYFFKDREFIPASDGKRKRIFHIVRVHARNTKKGKIFIKAHFRGMRRFNWNGYKLSVGMPGKHTGDMLEFHIGTQDFPGNKIPDGYIGHGEMTRMVGDALN
jgi:hypothetical protein